MKRYRLTTASGKVFHVPEPACKITLEEVRRKWMGESMHYGETSSKVIGVEEAEDGPWHWPFKPYEAKVISFNVVLFDGYKHLSMSLLARSVDDAKKLLEDFFGGYLPAYDLFLHGTCVHQYNGQKK